MHHVGDWRGIGLREDEQKQHERGKDRAEAHYCSDKCGEICRKSRLH